MDASHTKIVTALATAIVLVCLFAIPATQAANLGFLKDSPMSYFDDEDMRLLHEAALKVLENKSSRTKERWTNPATGHSGQVEGRGAFTAQDGLACRRVRVSNSAEGVEGQATYTVCKDAEKGWMINPAAKPAS
jgi:surface antigen